MKDNNKSENLPLLIFGSFVWGSVVAVTLVTPLEKDLSRFYDIANFVTGGIIGVISKEKIENYLGDRRQPKTTTKRMAWVELPQDKIEKLEDDNYEQY